MKKIAFLLLSVFVFQCNNLQNTELNVSIFDSSSLTELALDDLPSFWGMDSVYKSRLGVFFENQNGYIDELVYSSDYSRTLCVEVFTSESTAIAAMELYIKDCSAIIKKGDPANSNSWWYSDSGFFVLLSLSKFNTIIQAIQPGHTFYFENDSLWIPVNEISNRIGKLAKKQQPQP